MGGIPLSTQPDVVFVVVVFFGVVIVIVVVLVLRVVDRNVKGKFGNR